ncbi:MAG TPA: DNA topoisomerase VI subunit B [Kiritimatiellia bacterium]|nr:DNA topoisomerase VI subunit B [Kiritimatiellia bacterium]HNS80205.1 DNA topoisomerase VI subunit B [Kiritimatiellia bacterium]
MASAEKNTNKKKTAKRETAESMAQKQREISVSEFFLKNRHLLGFDSPRKALLTAVKEAVDNALDACEEAGILPDISVDIAQTGASRFRINVTDNGPGIVKAQIPKIFGKLLYGSKFHRLRMSRGQQGIGISAAGMYGQLTTGNSTVVLSKTRSQKHAHRMEVQLDTASNKPTILKEEEVEWLPAFYPAPGEGKETAPVVSHHGTSVSIEMEAAYVRGRLSVDEYVKQCAIVNPHLEIHYRISLLKSADEQNGDSESPWTTFRRVVKTVPEPPQEIKPHPHGVELGMLMKMLKDSAARNVCSALAHDFSRISSSTAHEICERAQISPKARPSTIAHRESEALFKAIQETKLMRPPTDCLSPIGEEQLTAGLKKEVEADFYTAITRKPSVYRGNPFQVEVAMAYARPGASEYLGGDDPVRVLRFANRVPLLYMAGACAITRAVSGVNWRAYGLNQPKGGLPVGPLLVSVHIASVWVPFTSESKEAIAHYPEIVREITFGLQECGRQLSVFLSRKKRAAEAERKRNYMEQYIPHLALGLRNVLDLDDKQEKKVIASLHSMLEHTHLQI